MLNIILCDGHSANEIILRNFIHDIQHKLLDDRPESSGTCLFLRRLFGNSLYCLLIKLQIHLIQQKKLLILFQDRILWLCHDSCQHFLCHCLQGEDHRQTSQKLRNHAKFPQILHGHLRQDIFVLVIGIGKLCLKTDGRLTCETLFDDLVQLRKCTAADKQYISRIDGGHRHHGIFVGGTYRHLHLAALQKL